MQGEVERLVHAAGPKTTRDKLLWPVLHYLASVAHTFWLCGIDIAFSGTNTKVHIHSLTLVINLDLKLGNFLHEQPIMKILLSLCLLSEGERWDRLLW